VESWHPGRFSKKQSFISMQSPDGVILDTIKKADDNEEMLIKLFEVNGTDSMTIVNFESHPTLFWDTLFTEEADRKTPHDVGYKMKQIFFPIKAHETKFLRVFFMNP
jgi:alpha-mannosidase